MHVSICLSWRIEIFTEAFVKHPSAVSLKSNRAWLWWHAASHSSIYKHKPQRCASMNGCLDFTSLHLVYFQNHLRSLNSFLEHFSTEATKFISKLKQKELNLLIIHLNSYNGQYKEPDIRRENHRPLTAWQHQTFTLHLYLNQYFQQDFTLHESNILWQLCWDTNGQRARLADVGQIHTPVKRHSFETTAGFTRSLLGQMCLQNVSITPIPHLCRAGFLPGWNPKSAEPNTANYFHALLTLTHVCLQHPAIPSPGNGA